MVFLVGWVFTACHEEKAIEYTTNSEHTLLIYMVGDDGSMSTYVAKNMAQILQGLQEAVTPLNVVIYHDNRTYGDDLPVLFQLKKRDDSHKIDTIYLKKWDKDLDSTDPGHMANVIDITFQKFDTPIKGFEYWGHGLSWIPGNKYVIPDSATTRSMEYIGADNGDKTDIWEMSDALENTGTHFDYMIFDACNMGTAEVAYELRHVTDYILAAPTETQIEGFPYKPVIQALSSICDEKTIIDGLTLAYDAFREEYNGRDSKHTGTLSLIYTSGLERLRQACLHLEQQAADGLALWRENPAEYGIKVQQYGGANSNPGSKYYFYDVQDWADNLSTMIDGVDGSEVADALEDCILLHYNTNWFYNLPLQRCHGLGMSIPEFWGLSKNNKLDAAYRELQWQL